MASCRACALRPAEDLLCLPLAMWISWSAVTLPGFARVAAVGVRASPPTRTGVADIQEALNERFVIVEYLPKYPKRVHLAPTGLRLAAILTNVIDRCLIRRDIRTERLEPPSLGMPGWLSPEGRSTAVAERFCGRPSLATSSGAGLWVTVRSRSAGRSRGRARATRAPGAP